MTDAQILEILKTDLEISAESRNDFLNALIQSAKEQIAIEGITLDATSTNDGMLVERYAAFLFRKRREDVPMPRNLRIALNNRLFHEKMSGVN